MRQSSLFHLIPLVFIYLLFFSACAENQEDEVSGLEAQRVNRSLIAASEAVPRSMATKTPSPSSSSRKTPQGISEAPERVEIPFSKSSSPKSLTSPITATLTPTNGSFANETSEGQSEEAGKEAGEEAGEESNEQLIEESSREPSRESGRESSEESNEQRNEESSEEPSRESGRMPSEELSEKLGEEPSEESSEEAKKVPNLPAGNTVHFQASLDTDEENSFPFLATADSVILVNTAAQGELKLSVEVQDMRSDKKIELFAKMDDQDTAVYKIPAGGGPLYRVLIKSVGGSKGDYRGFFIGSAGIGFSLLPIYGVTARLAEKGTLAYIYTGKAESTVQFNLSPRPEDNLNLVVRIYKISDLQTLLFEEGLNGVDEKLQFLFTPPEEEFGTYLVMVEDASGHAGKFKMTIKKGDLSDSGDDLTYKIRMFL